VAEVFFFLTAIAVFAGAIGVVTFGNPFYNVLALVVHLFGLAGMFLLLRAEFVAFAQIIVYAGAVMVLYVFVVAYVGGQAEPLGGSTSTGSRTIAVLCAGALLIELCIAILGSGLKALGDEGAGYTPGFGTPGDIGELLLTKFLFPFEAASILLLIAAVGAVVLARRRAGAGPIDEDRITVMEALYPAGTGTMAEAASGITGAAHYPQAQPLPPGGEGGPESERGREPAEAGGW
jgi:NADH-quinone oxidoreductase subunit J